MKHLSLLSITALIIAMLCSCESTISEADSSRDVSVAGKTFVATFSNNPNDYMEIRFTQDSLFNTCPLYPDNNFKSAYTQEDEFVYYTNEYGHTEVIISYGKFIKANFTLKTFFLKD